MPELTNGFIIFIAFVAVTVILLFYYLWFFRRLAFYKPKIKSENLEHPVSVIVCARDEDENLARNVPGLIFQQYQTSKQIIVVNDNSQDDSKYILQELNKTFKALTVIELEQEPKLIAGKKFPLSVGIREAKHEILLLTDADCVPASEFWIERMQAAYDADTEIVLGYGAYQKLPGFLNKLIRFETFHTALQYLSYALAGVPYMGVGRNLSYKKNVFLRNKGFSAINHIPGGDDDLFINRVANKRNTAIAIHHEAHTISQAKTKWADWKRQKTRHYSTSKYYKPLHKLLLGLYSFVQFLFYPLFIAALFLYDWRFVLGVFSLKLIVQTIVYIPSLKKLNEKDLIPWFLLMDIWMFFYYIIFSPTLFKKTPRTW